MNYRIIILDPVLKETRKFPRKDQQRISDAIDSLGADPFRGKKLEGEYAGGWAIRVWPYRIIYTIQKHLVTVTVVKIGHRRDVYR
ncbi:MAG: type II toxin-antitoxin system RelE/ParE family toxin [Patescibacteria group bacterium]